MHESGRCLLVLFMNYLFNLSFRVFIKLSRHGRETSKIFAIDVFDTDLDISSSISSSFPSSLDFPVLPLGLPISFPLNLAARSPCFVLSETKSRSISAKSPNKPTVTFV